ncbi:MAG: outer membrane lipoprotein-sorting protein [Acidobacteriaceae bacterium]
MTRQRWQWALVAVMAVGPAWAAQNPSQPQSLQDALTLMDRSAAQFQSVEADISVDLYTAVVQDHEFQKGTTAFRRSGGSMEMATTINKGQQGETDLLYKNGQLEYYLPQRKSETIFSAGANRQEWDSLLATGFGATGKELASAWTVKFDGMDASVPTAGGTPTAKLELVSKDARVRNNFSQVTIWVDLSRDISMKQIFLQPDGDSRTVTYSNIRYNKPVNDKLFELKVAAGTQVQRR